jgi:hypothetical protein
MQELRVFFWTMMGIESLKTLAYVAPILSLSGQASMTGAGRAPKEEARFLFNTHKLLQTRRNR